MTEAIRYLNIIPEALCDSLISRFEADPNKRPGDTIGGYNPGLKSTTDWFGIPDNKDDDIAIFKGINRCVTDYMRRFPVMRYLRDIEDTGYLMMKYEAPDGYFAPHVDHITEYNQTQHLAGVLYLNDNFKGGETCFLLKKKKVTPKKASFLMFPGSWPYVHKSAKMLQGSKYVISTFFIEVAPGT